MENILTPEFENQCLSIGREFLPAVALKVLDFKETLTVEEQAEYENWILSQALVTKMTQLAPNDLETFVKAYVEAALWSSTDDDDKPLDETYQPSDLAPETLAEFRKDCESFCAANTALLEKSGGSLDLHGHDFWLTRNGHGAGFWDRGYGAIGDQLSEAAKAFGEVCLVVSDGKIYA